MFSISASDRILDLFSFLYKITHQKSASLKEQQTGN